MKKLLLTLILLFLCSNAFALTNQYACTSGGTWSGSIWVLTTGAQVACTGGSTPITTDEQVLNSSSGNVTLTASTSTADLSMSGYTGTFTINSAVTLTDTGAADLQGVFSAGSPTTSIIVIEGGVTLDATPTGSSFPLLNFTTANQTLTSGGFTWPGNLNFSLTSGVFTLVGNWITSGLTTFSNTTDLNYTTTETYSTNNGLTLSAATISNASNATIIIGGGNWAGQVYLYNPVILKPSVSNISIQNVDIGASITYTPSTYSVSQSSGYVASIVLNSTINTFGMTWYEIQAYNTTNTITLSSTLSTQLLYMNQGNVTFTGSNVVTQSYLQNENSTVIFQSGLTLYVTNSLTFESVYGAGASTLKSGTASSPFYLVYTGPLSGENIESGYFTDVAASGTPIPYYGPKLLNYFGGTLTRTSGIVNVTAANINKKQINFYNGV